MRSFLDYITRKKQEYGKKFSTKSLDKRFVRYYESGERIRVVDKWGEVKSGTVGVTTGWKPVFLLMLTSRSLGSSHLLTNKDKIIK